MNTTIMAERQAKAIATIAAEVERLGGRLETTAARAPNPQVKHTLLLETVAAALAGIGAGNVTETNVTESPAPDKPHEVEPIEVVIPVVKRQEPPDKPAPKSRKGKEL